MIYFSLGQGRGKMFLANNEGKLPQVNKEGSFSYAIKEEILR